MVKWVNQVLQGVKVNWGVWIASCGFVLLGWGAANKINKVNSHLMEIKDGQEQAVTISKEALRLAQIGRENDSLLLMKIDSNKVVVDKMAREYVQALREDSISRDVWIDKMDGMWQYLDGIKKNNSQIAFNPNDLCNANMQ